MLLDTFVYITFGSGGHQVIWGVPKPLVISKFNIRKIVLVTFI